LTIRFKPGDLVKICWVAQLGEDEDGLGLVVDVCEEGDKLFPKVLLVGEKDSKARFYHPMWLSEIRGEHET
tara:strand:+ start:669 stop:881 length:213 start_codon:yes stop_codon:yes gene_type:complete